MKHAAVTAVALVATLAILTTTSVAAQSVTFVLGVEQLVGTWTASDVGQAADLIRAQGATSASLVVPPDAPAAAVDQMTRSLGLPRVAVVLDGRDTAANDIQVRMREAAVEVRFGNLSSEAVGDILESFPVQEVVVDIDDAVVASRVFALQSALVRGGVERAVVRRGAD